MHANEIHALYDRHHKVSPSPNPHLNARDSVKHEVIWKLQIIVCNMKYPRSWLRAFLDISGTLGTSAWGATLEAAGEEVWKAEQEKKTLASFRIVLHLLGLNKAWAKPNLVLGI